MDSSLILAYFEGQASPARKLLPVDPLAQASDLQTLGFILAAGEKAVQNVYEHNLRPAEKQHNPWIERITIQLLAACREWNTLLENRSAAAVPDQVAVTSTVIWTFIQSMIPTWFMRETLIIFNPLLNYMKPIAHLKNIPLVKLKEMKLNTQHESPRRPIAPGTRGRAETVQRGGKG